MVIDSANAGVCGSSLEAPQEEEPEVTPPTGQASKIQKPIPKEQGSTHPLDEIADTLLALGVKPNNALRTAAHGKTKDELINACMALEEAIASDAVKSKVAWLRSAFNGCYEPSEDWLNAKEAERRQEEARKLQEQELADQLALRRKQVRKIRAEVENLEASGSIQVDWDRSDFRPDGVYWYCFPSHPELGFRRSICEDSPSTVEAVLKRKQMIADMHAKVWNKKKFIQPEEPELTAEHLGIPF